MKMCAACGFVNYNPTDLNKCEVCGDKFSRRYDARHEKRLEGTEAVHVNFVDDDGIPGTSYTFRKKLPVYDWSDSREW